MVYIDFNLTHYFVKALAPWRDNISQHVLFIHPNIIDTKVFALLSRQKEATK